MSELFCDAAKTITLIEDTGLEKPVTFRCARQPGHQARGAHSSIHESAVMLWENRFVSFECRVRWGDDGIVQVATEDCGGALA